MATLRPFQETTINGPQSHQWTLNADECTEFTACHISRLGIDTARVPYARVRLRPEGSFFLLCLEGEGRVMLEGRWQKVIPGEICLAPPRVLNAFHAVAGKPWVCAWVRYGEPPWVKPLVGADSPLRITGQADRLSRAILGLRDEWEGDRDPPLVHHWVSLVHGMATRLAQPWRTISRIGELWENVARELATDWKLATLAKACSLSTEHLRRICVRELGRTPMEHVSYMRMRRAQELLESSEEKLETIAPQVGYHSATVFSRAFLRCMGMTPSEYRARR